MPWPESRRTVGVRVPVESADQALVDDRLHRATFDELAVAPNVSMRVRLFSKQPCSVMESRRPSFLVFRHRSLLFVVNCVRSQETAQIRTSGRRNERGSAGIRTLMRLFVGQRPRNSRPVT